MTIMGTSSSRADLLVAAGGAWWSNSTRLALDKQSKSLYDVDKLAKPYKLSCLAKLRGYT